MNGSCRKNEKGKEDGQPQNEKRKCGDGNSIVKKLGAEGKENTAQQSRK